MCLCRVFALFAGIRHNLADNFSLPVRSRKSAFGILIKFDSRHSKFPGPIN